MSPTTKAVFRCVYCTKLGWMSVSTCWEGTGSTKSAGRIKVSSVTHYTPGDGVMTNEGKNALLWRSIYICAALIGLKCIKKEWGEKCVLEIRENIYSSHCWTLVCIRSSVTVTVQPQSCDSFLLGCTCAETTPPGLSCKEDLYRPPEAKLCSTLLFCSKGATGGVTSSTLGCCYWGENMGFCSHLCEYLQVRAWHKWSVCVNICEDTHHCAEQTVCRASVCLLLPSYLSQRQCFADQLVCCDWLFW